MTTNSPTEQEGADSHQESLSPDTVLSLLSHHHRRVVLNLLLTQDRALTLRDLRNEIVEKEHGTVITEVDGKQAKQTLVSLHHVHIPMLAETDLVVYDQERKVVEPTKKLNRLEPFLSLSSEISN